MKHLIMKLSTSLLLISGLAMAAPASADGFAGEFTAWPWEPHGVLVGQTNRYSEGLHPVILTHINGRRLPYGRNNLWLKPGEYTIDATVLPSAGRQPTPGATRSTGRNRLEVEPLRIVVEDGKQYRIAGRYLEDDDSGRETSAALVLWKVTDDDGEVTFPLEEEDEEDQGGEEGEAMENDEQERVDTDNG